MCNAEFCSNSVFGSGWGPTGTTGDCLYVAAFFSTILHHAVCFAFINWKSTIMIRGWRLKIIYKRWPRAAIPVPVAKFIVPYEGKKVDYGIGLSYRPARLHRLAGRYDNPVPELTLSPRQGQWIWLLSIIPNFHINLDPPNFSLYTTFNVDGTQTYLIISFYNYANRNNSMVNWAILLSTYLKCVQITKFFWIRQKEFRSILWVFKFPSLIWYRIPDPRGTL